MRILYVLSGTEIRGGATKSFLAMADSVVRAGHEVAVVVPDEGGVTPVLRSRGWDVLVVPYMFATLPYLSWTPGALIKFLPRLVKARIMNRRARKVVNAFAEKWRPDIVHDNTSVVDLGHYAARQVHVPHLIHIREYGWKDFGRINPGLGFRLKAPGTYVAAITSALATFRGKGLDPSKVRVIYNGVVGSDCTPYISEKSPYFLYAGRITEGKGVADLVSAYVAYVASCLTRGKTPLGLKLAGGGASNDFMEEMRQKIEESGVEGYVEWLGEIEDVAGYYSKAAATVIPSKAEGFGRVMPEAMAAGSLCIVRNEGGLAEQLENGRRECGRDIAFGYGSIHELTDIFSDIGETYMESNDYSEGGRFYRMIADSRKVVGRLYSYEANARSILEYYSEIYNANKSSSR